MIRWSATIGIFVSINGIQSSSIDVKELNMQGSNGRRE